MVRTRDGRRMTPEPPGRPATMSLAAALPGHGSRRRLGRCSPIGARRQEWSEGITVTEASDGTAPRSSGHALSDVIAAHRPSLAVGGHPGTVQIDVRFDEGIVAP